MKMNGIIRERRKALSMTQEQMAERLGVSAPAVHKWEKGSTYPDITLLPALARLLKVDLNTLLSFEENLTDMEIEDFVNGLDVIVQDEGYEKAFQKAMDKIREYPSCDWLIDSAVLYLDGALFLYSVPESEKYREQLEPFYIRLAESEIPEIRDTAIGMLISYDRKRGDFTKAEERIQKIPTSNLDKEVQLGTLYQQQKRYEEAEGIWERRILKNVTEIQSALINLLEIALEEKRQEDAVYLADRYEEITRQFSLPEWMGYNAHLLLSLERKDREESLRILSKMLPAMKEEWDPRKSGLYRNMKDSGVTSLSGKVAGALCEELCQKEEYAFLRDCEEFQKLMEENSSLRQNYAV